MTSQSDIFASFANFFKIFNPMTYWEHILIRLSTSAATCKTWRWSITLWTRWAVTVSK